MLVFNKGEIRNALTAENIFDLLQEWGADPEYTNFGILSHTICHNHPGEGSKKLYYYDNSGLFKCYTGCDAYFDIFELTIKIMDIQHGRVFDLNDAVRWIAQRFGLAGSIEDRPEGDDLEDWKYLANYDRIEDIELKSNKIVLKEYDDSILDRFNYNVRIKPWLDEGIAGSVIENARIGFYAGGDQITIPHFDATGRFIGLRGRTLSIEDADRFGKYRPLKINKQLYNHPLGMNLYGYNWAKENIKKMGKAIIFESEKSVLKYASDFGWENNISVAICGSSVSAYQMQLLMEAGAKEIIIALDKQYKELNTEESKKWRIKLTKLSEKYRDSVLISIMWDKENLLGYKDSPIDCGRDTFLTLFKNRIIL